MSETLNLGNGNWGVKKDSLLGYNSENGNYKPLPFDFTRASSATVVNKDGLIETVGSGEPRIDFSNDAKGALLLEPTRMNILSYSEDFSNAYWQRYRGSITSNVTTSPDGTLNASRYQEDNQNGGHLFRRSGLSITNQLSYTGSIFAKKGELTSVRLASNSNSRWVAGAEFNLENGTVMSGTGVIENYGNGWYRCSISGNAIQTTGDAGFEIYTSVGVGRDGDGLFMYGAMFEQGSYATSYIPTSGSAATRSADSSSQTVPSGIIGQTEGVLFIDFVHEDSIPSDRWYVNLNDGGSNYIAIGHYSTVLYMRMFNGGEQAPINYNIPLVIGKRYKVAVSYALNNVSFYVDGVLFDTDTNATIPSTSIVSLQRGSFISKAKVNEVKLYNTRLSNAELQALTKI